MIVWLDTALDWPDAVRTSLTASLWRVASSCAPVWLSATCTVVLLPLLTVTVVLPRTMVFVVVRLAAVTATRLRPWNFSTAVSVNVSGQSVPAGPLQLTATLAVVPATVV
ncbi:MAG: hypothetical protein ACLPZR_07530 [Solirubrobacteraceae bacterium]